jgi:hypothetical protein
MWKVSDLRIGTELCCPTEMWFRTRVVPATCYDQSYNISAMGLHECVCTPDIIRENSYLVFEMTGLGDNWPRTSVTEKNLVKLSSQAKV